ncbi:MAG TPA: LLM class F420-dependent oxidoreductase [Microbacterium sp.]|uniref:LLM class F420-dependent oxidoreductase n=1 Tax=Microbacterium sp. TaxID=51671 RepID=UPI002B4A31BF|nr:LLM class F420-dependent oxidoreductase [Microbacterium sp.]HKT56802.1 LLM class F420-dependent oxidoreductase [Microbacterium sp.]
MRSGIHLWNYTAPGTSADLAPLVTRTAQVAEAGGFDQFTVMDHWFQMDTAGPAEDPMLEAYTTLGFVAGQTSRMRIGPLVSGVTYRHPGLLAKIATTLDVLSGGRSFLGIGAAWYEREHDALGVPYPAISERFERLEEALQIVLQMWGADTARYDGAHYRLAETLNSPQPVTRPHPPIMIGGKGERKTLRIAAQYAQIVNLTAFEPEAVAHLLDVLRRHCDTVGTDYDAIEKQIITTRLDPFADEYLAQAEQWAKLGIDLVVMGVRPNDQVGWTERLAADVVPRLAEL